jgi:hypothetical protein
MGKCRPPEAANQRKIKEIKVNQRWGLIYVKPLPPAELGRLARSFASRGRHNDARWKRRIVLHSRRARLASENGNPFPLSVSFARRDLSRGHVPVLKEHLRQLAVVSGWNPGAAQLQAAGVCKIGRHRERTRNGVCFAAACRWTGSEHGKQFAPRAAPDSATRKRMGCN